MFVIDFNGGVLQRTKKKKNTKSAMMNKVFRFFFFFELYAMQTDGYTHERSCRSIPPQTSFGEYECVRGLSPSAIGTWSRRTPRIELKLQAKVEHVFSCGDFAWFELNWTIRKICENEIELLALRANFESNSHNPIPNICDANMLAFLLYVMGAFTSLRYHSKKSRLDHSKRSVKLS